MCPSRGVDPFFGLGGGGGGNSKKNFKIFIALFQYNILRAKRTAKFKLCMLSSVFRLNLMVLQCLALLFKPIALHIMNFSSCQNYWGGGGAKRYVCPPIFSWGGGNGGGGGNDMFAPQYFHGGGCDSPPPPQDQRLCVLELIYR